MIFIFFFVLIVHYPTRSEYVISQDEFSESFLYYMKNEETISGSVRKQDSSSNSSSGSSSSSGTNSSCRDNEERMIIEPNSVVLLTDTGERLENNFVFHVPDGGKLLSVRYRRYQIPK